MNYRPLRLSPGDDLRRALEQAARDSLGDAAFVVAGIGSLSTVSLRFAGAEQATLMHGLFEIISLSGSLSGDGAHLHMSVASATGQVYGGHVGPGNVVRTTAEVLLVALSGWQFSREPDPVTGYNELRIRKLPPGEASDPSAEAISPSLRKPPSTSSP
jgi:predicted DNA-binding protein with PD1-like motif